MSGLLYENVAEDIIKRIRINELKEGMKLSERSLAAEYQVSRTAIRDALKTLNEQGYMDIKAGKGHYVKKPNEKDFSDKLADIISYSSIPIDDILTAREIIEPAMAEMIIHNATDEDIEKLEKILLQSTAAVDDRPIFNELDGEFHLAVMSCAKNKMLTYFVKTLNDTLHREQYNWGHDVRKETIREHEEMLNAIKGKKKKVLQKLFAEHIVSFRKCVMRDISV